MQDMMPQRSKLLVDDEDFNMLLELADEADENEEGEDLADPSACIPGSDGEVSDEEVQKDIPCNLTEEAKLPEPTPKRKKLSVPGRLAGNR